MSKVKVGKDNDEDKYKKKNKKGEKEDNLPLVENKYLESLNKFTNFIIQNANMISLILSIFSVFLYLISLRGCFDTQAECLKNLNEGVVRELLSYLNYSGLFYAIICTAVIYKYVTIYVLLMITSSFIYLCFYYDTGSNLDYHGAYNRIVLFFSIFLWMLILNLSIFIKKGLKTKTLTTSLLLVSSLIAVFIFYKMKITNSCKDWKKGFKDTEISFKDMPCKLQVPEICWFDIFGKAFDYSGWLNDNCGIIRNGDRSFYDDALKKNNPDYFQTNLIGFPRTENYTYDQSMHFVIEHNILKGLIDMNDPKVPDSIKNKTEVMIDYSGDESKVIIRVVRDEEIVKQRKPLYERQANQLLAKNLMIVYIDSISRRHWHRRMPKTTKWLEKFYKTDHPKYTSYQFLKYHATGYFTQINTIPAFLGKWWLETGGNYYTKYYKDKGAITAQTISICGRELFDLENDQFRHMNWESYDHEHIALFCDPNYHQVDNPYTPFLGAYSVRRRCLHGKDTHEYMLEYGYKFWQTYQDMPKVIRFDFIDAHEGTGNVVGYLDDRLEKFLTDMEKNNMLDDTIVLFMADHGVNMPGFVSLMESPDYNIEKYLPMLFLLVPEKVRKEYGEALSANEQSIVTPWDIHNTLLHAGGAPSQAYNPHGNSIFKNISNNRFSCRKFLIRDSYCVCKNNRKY